MGVLGVIFGIIITLIFLAIIVFVVADFSEDTTKLNTEIDKAELEVQEAQKEVQEAYDECVKKADKSDCDALVANNPNVKLHE